MLFLILNIVNLFDSDFVNVIELICNSHFVYVTDLFQLSHKISILMKKQTIQISGPKLT